MAKKNSRCRRIAELEYQIRRLNNVLKTQAQMIAVKSGDQTFFMNRAALHLAFIDEKELDGRVIQRIAEFRLMTEPTHSTLRIKTTS